MKAHSKREKQVITAFKQTIKLAKFQSVYSREELLAKYSYIMWHVLNVRLFALLLFPVLWSSNSSLHFSWFWRWSTFGRHKNWLYFIYLPFALIFSITKLSSQSCITTISSAVTIFLTVTLILTFHTQYLRVLKLNF